MTKFKVALKVTYTNTDVTPKELLELLQKLTPTANVELQEVEVLSE